MGTELARHLVGLMSTDEDLSCRFLRRALQKGAEASMRDSLTLTLTLTLIGRCRGFDEGQYPSYTAS